MLETATVSALPEVPYKGLDYYTAADGPLLAGRDVDAESCATLIASGRSRIMILQGRSGAGKSSFLRAALLPRLQRYRPGYHVLRHHDTSEPAFIRSTGHPVFRIHEALLRSIETDPELRQLWIEDPPCDLVSSGNEMECSQSCLTILKTLSAKLPRRLLLVLDQGEEVLTQGSRQDRDIAVAALVHFLLRVVRYDVKVIVSIRTEYYGHLTEILGRIPVIGRDHDAGIVDYMLSGFIDASELARSIERPTLSEPIEYDGIRYEAPRDRYGFKYESGLAMKIAADLIEHCGDASPLPIMQIVCRSLYDQVKNIPRPRIVGDLIYKKKDVRTRVEEYVDAALRDALRQPKAAPRVLAGWRSLLACLASRQSDSSVTTLLKREDELVKTAGDLGLGQDCVAVLDRLASDRWRVIRSIEVGTMNPRRIYSLGHDALGVVLCRWREDQDTAATERKRTMRWRHGSWGCVAVVLFLSLITLYSTRERLASDVTRLNGFALIDPSPEIRLRLLLLEASLRSTRGLIAFGLKNQAVDDIRKTLTRSPWEGGAADAVGISENGDRIATLTGSALRVLDMVPNGVGKQALRDRAPQWRPVDWNPEPLNKPSGTTLPPGPAVGFIRNLGLVIYKNGKLQYFANGAPVTINLTEITKPFRERDQKPLWLPEIGAGCLQFSGWRGPADGAHTTAVLRLCAPPLGNEKLQAVEGEISWPETALQPTYSSFEQRYAVLDLTDVANDHSCPAPNNRISQTLKVGLLDGQSDQRIPLGDECRRPSDPTVAKSFAFSDSSSYVVLRRERGPTALRVVPIGEHPSEKPSDFISYPKDVRAVMQQGPLQRTPLLAAVGPKQSDAQYEWRFAWLLPTGVAALESTNSHSASLMFGGPLFSGVESASRLRFSADGNYLVLVTGPWRMQKFRVWDLGQERQELIEHHASADELMHEACRVAGIEGTAGPYDKGAADDSRQKGNAFTEAELITWFGNREQANQPCSGE